MPKVSIIIPTYNVEDYLRECMDSVTRQTLKDIEIICINDGSTDGSLEILKEYADKDPRIVLVDKENEGYGVGMNIGLDKASGEYIGIVEPDDFVPLNMYEDLYNTAKENDLDFVKADFYRFTRNCENGNMELIYNHLDSTGENYNQVINPFEKPYITKFIMNTWSGIYRREYIEKYHIRHNTTPGASFQDNGFFWQTFMYARRCMFLDRPYYMNRRDNPNSSVNSREKVYCMNIEYDFIFFASLRLLQSSHKEAVDVACQWLSMLFERIHEDLSLLYSFCDNMLAMFISYGLEEGWKLETRVCSLFNIIIKKLPIDWCNRMALVFLHFFMHTMNVVLNLISYLDYPCG